MKQLQQLTGSGLKLGGIRPDACVALFEQCAISITSYAYGLCPPHSNRAELLDETQVHFANQFLGLPDDCHGDIGKSVLGLLDFQLRISRARLLMLHRVANNELDSLTNAMIKWPITPHGESFINQCQQVLYELDTSVNIQTLIDTPYIVASYTLKLTVQSIQQKRWHDRALLGPREVVRHARALHHWGLDSALLYQSPDDARNFIQFRAGVITAPESKSPETGWPVCAVCLRANASLTHLLWQCKPLRTARSYYLSSIPHRIHALIIRSHPDQAESIIMGGGGLISPGDWETIRDQSVLFISSVVQTVRNH